MGDVEVTLLPEELEGLDEAAVKALYEEKAAELRVGYDSGSRACCSVAEEPLAFAEKDSRAVTTMLRPPQNALSLNTQAASKREDFSDLVAAQAANQKRKIAAKADAKAAKKSKGSSDFKF